MKLIRGFAVICTAALAACATPAPVVQAPFIGVDAVTVSVVENASYGLLQSTQDPDLVLQFEQALEADVQTALISGGSGNSAAVTVERITIQSGVGRIVAAAESFVSGDVTISGADGSVIAVFDDVSFTNVAARNQSTFNGIPVGALLSMATNSSDASAEGQIAALSQGFAAEIAANLGR